MLRVALTGGIATGKSYVLARLASSGVPTIDADRVARQLVVPGQAACREIRERFGAEVFTEDGTLDRARLATRVFDDAAERAALEAILHPRVRARLDGWFEALRAARAVDYGVADIPLLF